MTPRQLWFNFWACFFGVVILVGTPVFCLFVFTAPHLAHPHLLLAAIAGQCFAAVLMIVGSCSNFYWGIPRLWPWALVVIGFILTGWGFPLAIWGCVIWKAYIDYLAGRRDRR